MRLLDIQSSPRGESSDSIALTKSFIAACKPKRNSVVVDTLNVWHERLPDFDCDAIGAKYKAIKHETMTAARIRSLILPFQNADRIVIGTPMWHFGLPYKLKHFIDLVTLFAYDGKQYGPLLNVKGSRCVNTQLTVPGGQSHSALAIRSPGDLFGLLVAACRCSRSSERD